MKKMFLGMVSLIAIIGLSGCSNPNEVSKEEMKTIQFMDNSELKSTFSDKTVKGKSYVWNNEFILTYNSDGTFDGTVANGEKKLSGKWYVKNDMKCQTYSSGKIGCTKHYKKGNKYYTVNNSMVKTSEFVVK